MHGVLWNGQEIASFERDDLHREVSRTLGNQLAASQQYDKISWLTQQTLAGKTSQMRSYQYDAVGQLLGINDSRSGATSYRYDPVGRLIAAASPHAKETFAFDPASNIPAIVGNLLKEYAGKHFKYDARGNLIEKQQGAQVQKLAWDGFNRLAALETPNGKTEYAYDVFGRRIAKRHNGQTTTFVWDGDVIALEKTAEQTRHYLFEAGSFVPLALVVEKDGGSNTAYYHVDHLGTPRLLTDADGEIAWQAEYKAWGEAKTVISQAAHSAGIDNPIRFQGQYFDAESGLHYNRHRYYDPETGRFISSDPIGLLGGLNTHAYAPNPVEWVDPFGLAGNPATATHVTYVGTKMVPERDPCGKIVMVAKPYVGYASMQGHQTADDVIKYRYGGDFTDFANGKAPTPIFSGYGQAGKDTARGLEQREFEKRGGLSGTANKQNPVGDTNKRHDEYLKSADSHNGACPIGAGSKQYKKK